MDEEKREYPNKEKDNGPTDHSLSEEPYVNYEAERNTAPNATTGESYVHNDKEQDTVSHGASEEPYVNVGPEQPASSYAPFSLYDSEDEKQWTPQQTQTISSPPPKKQKKKHKPFPWKKFWRTAAVAAFGLMLVFSTVTSAYLLKDNLSTGSSSSVAKVSQTSSSSGNVTQTSSSDSDDLTITEINKEVAPSVVLITGTNMSGTGEGTGMIISDDGYIVTNAHVVEDYSDIKVTLNDDAETEYDATLVGYDDTTDIAVLKIDATGLTPVTFGTSSDLEVGQSVVVIGNPLGEEFTGSVTTGIISALDREVEMDDGQVYTYIQTDAAINSGNSGGPLVNMSGQVIGINSAKIDSSVAEGMGFAIPIDTAIPVINDLIEYGYVTGRPYIGISGESINEEYSQYYNLPEGVHITAIASGSPAADSDLAVDDIITAINGTAVTSIGELNNIKNQSSPGDTVELTVYRYSTQKTFTVKIKMTEMTPSTTQ